MTHHPGFEGHSLDDAAHRAIKSHGQPEYALDPVSREMRREEHTGIELTGVELAYLRKVTTDRVKVLEENIASLEFSLSEGGAPNTGNAEEELQGKREELDFLENNLVEKLFGETPPR